MLTVEFELEEAREEGLEKGKEEGREIGLTEGSQQKQLEIARKMKARGTPPDQIAEDTGLPLETVLKL
jgi:predicted transposase/invertase (TIGR01784 family)